MFNVTLLTAVSESVPSAVPEGEGDWEVEVVRDDLSRENVSEEGHSLSDHEDLPIIPVFPEEWKSVTPSEIIKIAGYREFTEYDAPSLHRTLAAEFAQSATPLHLEELLDVYHNSSSPTSRGQLCLLVREVKSPEGLDVLFKLVANPPPSSSPDDPLLNCASYALWSSEDPSMMEGCMKILLEGTSRSHNAVASSMPEILSPVLLPFLSDIIEGKIKYAENPWAFPLAVGTLGHIQSERSRDMLEELRKSPNSDIANSAEEAARHLRSTAPGLYSAIGQ